MIASLLVGLHVIAGSLALLAMPVPLFSKKGSRPHVLAGRIYFVAMLAAASSAILLAPVRMLERPPDAWQPSLFLAYTGLLSLAASVHGVRALRRRDRKPARADFVLPAALLLASLALAAFAWESGFTLGLVFSGLGLLVALPQLRVLTSPPPGRGWWVGEHIVGMMIACISTLTAFLVVNAGSALGPYSIVLWLAPTAALMPLMIHWTRRYTPRRKQVRTAAE